VFERFTERARQVVVLAQDEARALKHHYIGTEHVLLGLARENEGVAARILLDFDADAERIRSEVIRTLSGSPPPEFVPESPPLAPEVVAEIERVRRERPEAAGDDKAGRVAALRERELRLVGAAKG